MTTALLSSCMDRLNLYCGGRWDDGLVAEANRPEIVPSMLRMACETADPVRHNPGIAVKSGGYLESLHSPVGCTALQKRSRWVSEPSVA